jgi:hypothetical protein
MGMSRVRLALACALAPLSAPVAMILVGIVVARALPTYRELGVTLWTILPTAYIGTLLVGLPIVYSLSRRQRVSWLTLAVAGAAVGPICFLAFLVVIAGLFGYGLHVPRAPEEANSVLFEVLYSVFLGLVVAVTFAAIIGAPRRRSPYNRHPR